MAGCEERTRRRERRILRWRGREAEDGREGHSDKLILCSVAHMMPFISSLNRTRSCDVP